MNQKRRDWMSLSQRRETVNVIGDYDENDTLVWFNRTLLRRQDFWLLVVATRETLKLHAVRDRRPGEGTSLWRVQRNKEGRKPIQNGMELLVLGSRGEEFDGIAGA